jgi:hypothetical protein
MRLMKVIRNKRSNPNKEFEHDEELRSILLKGMMKIHSIQCISIRNQFRMKLMTMIHNMQNMINKELK